VAWLGFSRDWLSYGSRANRSSRSASPQPAQASAVCSDRYTAGHATSVVPNWRTGDTIPLGHRTLKMAGIRDDDADQPPVLVVEDE